MRIRIYDTEGELRYGQSDDDQKSRFLSEAYRNAKLRFLIDTHGDSVHIICYVRAIESKGQRSDQFYVDIISESPAELSEIKREAVKKLNKLFYEVDLSNPTTDIFKYLDAETSASQYLPEEDLQAVRSLADQGERLDFGAGDQHTALSMIKSLSGISAKIVVADAGRTDYYDDAEVVLDTGFDGDGIAASKETSKKIQQFLQSQSKNVVEKKIANIEEQAKELKELKKNEDLSDSAVDKPLKKSLKRQFPGIFQTGTDTRGKTRTTKTRTSKTETSTKPRDITVGTQDSGKDGLFSRVPSKALGGVLIIGILALLIAGVAVSGFSPSDLLGNGNGNNDSPGGNGGDGTDGGDRDNGEESNTVTFDGDIRINDKEWGDIEVSDETLNITGEVSNANEEVTVEGKLTNSNSDITKTDETQDVFDLSFEKEDVQDEMGYKEQLELDLTLSIDDEDDTREAEVTWDTRLPANLTLIDDNRNNNTVNFTVRNQGNKTGKWRVILRDGDDDELNSTDDINLEGGDEDDGSLDIGTSEGITIACESEEDDCFDDEDIAPENVSESPA